MPKYKYILNDGTTQDTDLELAQGSYIIKRSYDNISSTFVPDENTIRGTIIARGTDVSGEINVSTYSGSMPYAPTENLAIYRDNQGNWYLDTSACTSLDTDFPYYTASLACIGNKTTGRDKSFIYDLSIQRILVNIDLADTRDYNGTTYYRLNSLSGYYYEDVAGTPTPEHPYENATTSISNFCVGFMNYDGYSETFGMMYAYSAPFIRCASGYFEKPMTGRNFFSLQQNNSVSDSDVRITLTFPNITDTTSVGNEYIYENGDRIIRFYYDARDRTGDYTVWLNKDAFLKQLANYGFAFRFDGVIYKPTVEGGVVTGYTNDLNSTSEWDNWKNIGDHSFPSSPKKQGTPDDGISDMELGFTGYENGFVNYYICTSGAIANLVGEMSSQTDYPNLMGNIVSLKSYACTLNGMYTGDIVPIKVGQYQSTAEGIKITTTTYSKQIASFSIKGAHGDLSKPHFLDFAPHTRLEIYIPFCGTVPLPPECMYNTVTVHIVTDITSGSCTGVVKCRGNIVAQKAGIIGTTIPLSINDSASQNNAFNQGMMNTATAGGKVISGGAVGSVNAGGILGALGSSLNTVQTMNDNYTRVIGTQGDKSAYAMPKKCYLKRYRTIDLSDDNYTATIGRPVCKRRALSSGDGFTVCDNPQVHGSMTLAEKNEIEQFMRNGIIL